MHSRRARARPLESVRITIVGTVERMDGQKSIWLEQMRAARDVRFSFVTFHDRPAVQTTFMQRAAQAGVSISYTPLPGIYLAAHGISSGSHAVDMILSALLAATDIIQLREPLIRRRHVSSRLAHQILEMMTPSWGREYILSIVGALAGADVVALGNSRDKSDALIVAGAYFAGASGTVFDLLNLHPTLAAGMRPSVVVAPSRFAALHSSVVALTSMRDFSGCTTVIHPGIDTERFSPATRNSERRWQRLEDKIGASLDGAYAMRPFVVAFVGRLEPEKSPGLFIKMAAKLMSTAPECRVRKCKFVVLGAGSLRKPLEELAARVGVRVHFMGLVDRDTELVHAYRSFDVLVNPSLRSSETFCIVNVEAMAVGVPLVSFGAGGVRDYLEDGATGVIADSPTPSALAEGVRRILLMPPVDVQRLSDRARARGSYFARKRMVEAYEEMYYKFG